MTGGEWQAMNRSRCQQCGLLNFATDPACRRCSVPLDNAVEETVPAAEGADQPEPVRRHRIVKVALRIGAVVGCLLLVAYGSLIFTSDPLSREQQQLVARAIDLLEQKGFGRDAFILRHLVSFRATDNWWNRWVGHGMAYASTNFPFEVVTLYPDFFTRSADDVERAVILLHEASHLRGHGEGRAHEVVWLYKHRLGWTKEAYEKTRVWKNVREFTLKYAPRLFRCGPDGQSDCMEISPGSAGHWFLPKSAGSFLARFIGLSRRAHRPAV
jgi:hypothetical protein